MIAAQWKPGQSGNPSGGWGNDYQDCVRACREASPQAAQRLIHLMSSEDERVALMAADKVMERAWGKPREHDPNAAGPTRPDLSALTDKQLAQVQEAIKILLKISAAPVMSDKEPA